MDVIIYKKADGGVALGLVHDNKGKLLCDPEAEGARMVAETLEFIGFRVTDSANLPGGNINGMYDRQFRDAFTDDTDGPGVGIDMPRARGIHMERIRRERDAELARLDIEQLKGNDVTDAKQILRNLPDTFDISGARTPAALKKLWPIELAAR